jgi:hypothetical protein
VLRSQAEEVSCSIDRHMLEVGLVRIASDVTPDLALQTTGSLTVLGALQASKQIKAGLATRIK